MLRSAATRRVFAVAAAGAVIVTASLVASIRVPDEPLPCPTKIEPAGESVARQWDETALAAIRRALPNPPVHARNLFHLSVAMWDAWAAYEPSASGYVFKEKILACDTYAARKEAISYAAYRVLTSRFSTAVGAPESLAQFDALMKTLAYATDVTTIDGDTPAALGNRIAKLVLEAGLADGSNEQNGYASPSYHPVNPALIVALPDIKLTDPNRWQPLQVDYQVSQNGIPVPGLAQVAIGPHWGHVTPFAIAPGGAAGMPIDPGAQPRLGDAKSDGLFKLQAVEVIRDSAMLDDTTGTTIDASPATRGANTLGSNDGHGYRVNPSTGAPYAADPADPGDFYRALAEFWADGPNSETPPGHWNVIANAATDQVAPNLRIGGAGRAVGRLEWDVKLYLALNGALHDAAIAAWGIKGGYDGARPISMIRYMASLGQSSDRTQASYNNEGLPLVPGLIEVITRAKTALGRPMELLRGHEGEIAVRAWQRNTDGSRGGHVDWMLGTTWVPYQLPTFVTPSFPGYISGHSTFSRSAAEVLTAITGSQYFPGGLAEWTVPGGSFRIADGPRADVVLQWATYYDAADQAGQSRLFGGIHVQADDFAGRIVGSTCGKDAWIKAQRLYDGLER